MPEQWLTIGAFARRARLSVKALRLYERLGLLLPADIDPNSGYRRYREDQLFTARLIVGLRRLDMPLSEVVQVVSVPGKAGADVLSSYWEWVERRFAAQRELAEQLRQSLLDGDTRFTAFDVRERTQPEQIVLAEARVVDISTLPATIREVTEQLTKRVTVHGGACGDQFIIYHGEVNEDSVGPIEICIPVATESAATRREPAHRQAYVTITRAQLGWPQILTAYDAVQHWIDQHRRRCIGSPREIYRPDRDPASAAPTDEVCDVAFPIA